MKKCVFKKFILFFSLIFILLNFIFSQSEEFLETEQMHLEITSELKVNGFNITGLKRTKDYYMKKLLSDFEGQAANEETIKEIETVLQMENLFDEIQISIVPTSENEANIDIFLKEKLSFFPLPVILATGDSFMGGIGLVDMNAFGIHDMFAVGGLFASNMQMGLLAYAKQPKSIGNFGFMFMSYVSNNEVTLTNAYDEDVLEYDAFSIVGGLKILYKLSKCMLLDFELGYIYFYPSGADILSTVNEWNTGLGWSIAKTSWNGYFLSTSGISLLGSMAFADDEDYRIGKFASASAYLQIPIVQKLRLTGNASAFISDNLHYSQFKDRKAGGISILNSKFKTQDILGAKAGAEFCVLKIKFGTLSIFADYQIALAQDWDESLYFGHGPEAGVCVYLAKLAIPALSFATSYNIENESWQFSFSLGATF